MMFLLTEETELLLAQLAEQTRGGGSREERMRGSLDVYFAFLVERPLAARIFQGVSATDPDVAEAAHRMRGLAREGTAALLGRGGGPELEACATVLVASVLSMADWWAQRPQMPRHEVADMAMRRLWPGVSQTLAVSGRTPEER